MADHLSNSDKLFSPMSILKNLLKIGFVVGVLYYLWSKGHLNIERTFQAFKKIDLMIPAVFLVATPIFIVSYRLKLLLKGQKIEVNYFQALSLTFIGMFFNTSLPGAVSGDVVKGYYLFKITPGLRRTQAITAMLVDRIIGVSGLIVLASIVLLFKLSEILITPGLQSIAFIILVAIGIVSVFFAFVLFPFSDRLDRTLNRIEHIKFGKLEIGSLFKKFITAVRSYRDNLPILAISLGLSVFVHSLIVIGFSLFAKALGETSLTLSDFAFLTPLGLITAVIPVAPAGIGVGHAAFQALYKIGGSDVGADAFSIYASIQIFLGLCGSVPYIMFRKPGEDLSQMVSELEETP